MRGWVVWVDRELADEHGALAKEALADLDRTLGEILDALPEKSRALLRRLPVFLMLGEKSRHGGRNNGLEYFSRNAPKRLQGVGAIAATFAQRSINPRRHFAGHSFAAAATCGRMRMLATNHAPSSRPATCRGRVDLAP